MVELSELVHSFLTSDLSPTIKKDCLRNIERWMHSGLKPENSNLIQQCLRKVFPVAFLRRMTCPNTDDQPDVWASLLAAFLDTKCWSGSQLNSNDAIWCELTLLRAPIYLVDVVLQMSRDTISETFVSSISQRVFSLPPACIQRPTDALRIIIFYKWLTCEQPKLNRPALKDVIRKYIDTDTLKIWIEKRSDRRFSEDEPCEQFVNVLIQAYDLSELVHLLNAPSTFEQTVVPLVSKRLKLDNDPRCTNQRVAKRRRKLHKQRTIAEHSVESAHSLANESDVNSLLSSPLGGVITHSTNQLDENLFDTFVVSHTGTRSSNTSSTDVSGINLPDSLLADLDTDVLFSLTSNSDFLTAKPLIVASDEPHDGSVGLEREYPVSAGSETADIGLVSQHSPKTSATILEVPDLPESTNEFTHSEQMSTAILEESSTLSAVPIFRSRRQEQRDATDMTSSPKRSPEKRATWIPAEKKSPASSHRMRSDCITTRTRRDPYLLRTRTPTN